MKDLALKYRPTKFEDVIGQDYAVKILQKQVETNAIPHCILLAGPSGCGKTTLARIYANEVNRGQGKPIEIDGASNNGVDNVREIIEDSKSRALDCTYKVYIIDECHMITTAGWNAFLKCIEEPPMFTVFIFCTTDPQKLPETIRNRMMTFNLVKVGSDLINARLSAICDAEGYTNYKESCDYISKLSNGCVRQAIQNLDKVAELGAEISIDNVLAALNIFSYDKMFILVNSIIDKQAQTIINVVERVFNQGVDLKQFTNQFVDFVTELNLFCTIRDMAITCIPKSYEKEVKLATGVCATPEESLRYYTKLTNRLLDIRQEVMNSFNTKATLETRLLGLINE